MANRIQVALARPEWNHEEYFREKLKDVTIMICQRKTRDLIQLCLTSILNHYPEIKVLVVDGHSEDDSVEWLRFMSAKYPNVKLWERPEGRNSHGETMHETMAMIETKCVLLMDSDTIVRRGGFVEGMLRGFEEFDEGRVYAVGSLMLQSIKGEACSQPIDETDVLRYAHPSCSMYDVEIYKTLQPFTDHGAPCALNNIDAQKKGYRIEYFPVDKYVQHLCGASWQEVPTVWNDDGDVQIRPLVTFICGHDTNFKFIKQIQGDDFNIIIIDHINIQRKISTYDRGELEFFNKIFESRFKVNGYYVCDLTNEHIEFDEQGQIDFDSLETLRKMAINGIKNGMEQMGIGKLIFQERKHWQKYHSIK